MVTIELEKINKNVELMITDVKGKVVYDAKILEVGVIVKK
jgi:hypothetical protein